MTDTLTKTLQQADLMVVHDLRRSFCPLCRLMVQPTTMHLALERGFFCCGGEYIRVVSPYVINELALA